MNYLLQKAHVVAPSSEYHNKTVDILIEKGKIKSIGKNLKSNDVKIINSPNLIVTPGWLDMRCFIPDPGFEYKETIESALAAAALGGFTGIAAFPNTSPIRDSKSDVLYALDKAKGKGVELFAVGAVSDNLEGKNLAELFDMHNAGAIAFTEGKDGIQDDNLMLRALLYAKGFKGLVINLPNTNSISQNGKMNEGENSTLLGLKGLPSIAEELMISRDLFLLSYTEGKLHLGPISAKNSVQLIKEGKKKGLNLSCETSILNLIFDDSVLSEFDTNYKVFPPLRTKADQTSLIKAINEGIIDVVSSNHKPENIENKDVEFDHAKFGATNLETFYSVYNQYLSKKITLEKWVDVVSVNPRRILGLNPIKIEEGEMANLTLLDPTLDWNYKLAEKKSLSNNSSFIDKKMVGKVVGVINKGKVILN